MIKYEEELIKVLKQSEKEAINLKHGFIGTEHFLIGTLSQNNELSNILKKEINKNVNEIIIFLILCSFSFSYGWKAQKNKMRCFRR